MTHDWFSHLEEGHNADEFMKVGCETQLSTMPRCQQIALGCRPGDRIDKAYVAESGDPATFTHAGVEYATRAPKTIRNTNTAWWDASQIYGYDERSLKRVKRDPQDRAKLLLDPDCRSLQRRHLGYLPLLAPDDPMNPDWKGQEATAFPDNWTIGMSFLHNLFAREHNLFVDEFRRHGGTDP